MVEVKGLKRDTKRSFVPGSNSQRRKSRASISRIIPVYLLTSLSNQWEQKYVYRSPLARLACLVRNIVKHFVKRQWVEEGTFLALFELGQQEFPVPLPSQCYFHSPEPLCFPNEARANTAEVSWMPNNNEQKVRFSINLSFFFWGLKNRNTPITTSFGK